MARILLLGVLTIALMDNYDLLAWRCFGEGRDETDFILSCMTCFDDRRVALRS